MRRILPSSHSSLVAVILCEGSSAARLATEVNGQTMTEALVQITESRALDEYLRRGVLRRLAAGTGPAIGLGRRRRTGRSASSGLNHVLWLASSSPPILSAAAIFTCEALIDGQQQVAAVSASGPPPSSPAPEIRCRSVPPAAGADPCLPAAAVPRRPPR